MRTTMLLTRSTRLAGRRCVAASLTLLALLVVLVAAPPPLAAQGDTSAQFGFPAFSAQPASAPTTAVELLPIRGDGYLASVDAMRRATEAQLKHVSEVITSIKAQIEAIAPHLAEPGRKEELGDQQGTLDIARDAEDLLRQSSRNLLDQRQIEEERRQANDLRQARAAELLRPESGGDATKDGAVTLEEADKARQDLTVAQRHDRETELALDALKADSANLEAALAAATAKAKQRNDELTEARSKLREEQGSGSARDVAQLLSRMVDRAELARENARERVSLARRRIDLLAQRRDLLAFELATARMDVALKRRRAVFLDDRVSVSGDEVDARERRWRAKLIERDQLRAKADQLAQKADEERDAAQARHALAQDEERRATTREERELAQIKAQQAGYEIEIADAHQRLAEIQGSLAQAQVDHAKEIFDYHSTMKDLREGRVSNADLADRLSELRSASASVQLRLSETERQTDEVRASRRAAESSLESLREQIETETVRADPARAGVLKALQATRKTLSHLISEKEDLAAQVAGLSETLSGVLKAQTERARRIERELGISRIWERRPSALSWSEVGAIGQDLAHARDVLAATAKDAPQMVGDFFLSLASLEKLGRVILLLGLAYIVLACVMFAQRRLRAVSRRAGSPGSETLGALSLAGCRVARRAIPFAAAVVLARAAGELLPVSPALWSGIELLFLAALLFSIARGLMREVLAPHQPSRRLVAISPAAASHIYTYGHLICLFSAALLPLAVWLPQGYELLGLPVRQAAVELVWLIYKLGAALLVFFLAYEKELLLALLPAQGDGMAGLARRVARVLYPLLTLFVLSLFALGSIGYVDLARYLIRATGGSAIAVAIGYTLQHILRTWLLAALSAAPPEGEDPVERERSRQWADRTATLSRWVITALVLGALYVIWGGDRETAATVWAYLTLAIPFGPFTISVARLAEATLTIYVAMILSRWFREVLERAVFPHTGLERGVRYALSLALHYSIIAVSVSYALETLGLGMEYVKWFVGAIGVGAGFGLQNIVYNLISGVVLLVEQPVRIGDFIEVGGISGRVDRISIRSSTVRTDDNIEVIVPNSELVSQKVANWTHTDPVTKISVNIQVPYGTDPELVRHSLLEVAAATANVMRSPAPWVSFQALGTAALLFQLQVCCREPGLRIQVLSDLNFGIERTFRRHRIPIAHTPQDVWVPVPAPADASAARPPAGKAS